MFMFGRAISLLYLSASCLLVLAETPHKPQDSRIKRGHQDDHQTLLDPVTSSVDFRLSDGNVHRRKRSPEEACKDCAQLCEIEPQDGDEVPEEFRVLCACYRGFRPDPTPQYCKDINECSEDPQICGPGGRCINTAGSFVCRCAQGFSVSADGRCMAANACAAKPCEHLCHSHDGSFSCACHPGYSLVSHNQCEDIDECLEVSPCSHLCINTPGSFLCRCPAPLQLSEDQKTCIDSPTGIKRHRKSPLLTEFGTHKLAVGLVRDGSSRHKLVVPLGEPKEDDRVHCQHLCLNGGSCRSGRCHCPPGVTGDTCQHDVNECAILPPELSCSHHCENTFGSFLCVCPLGWVLGEDRRTCAPVACAPACMNGGTCVNGICYCPPGFEGPACGVDVDECTSSPCAHLCRNTLGSFACLCRGRWKLAADGRSCVEPPCVPHCRNRGVCRGGHCVCKPGFHGRLCQLDINECASSETPCKHACVNSFGSFQCLCPPRSRLAPDRKTCIYDPLADYDSQDVVNVIVEVLIEDEHHSRMMHHTMQPMAVRIPSRSSNQQRHHYWVERELQPTRTEQVKLASSNYHPHVFSPKTTKNSQLPSPSPTISISSQHPTPPLNKAIPKLPDSENALPDISESLFPTSTDEDSENSLTRVLNSDWILLPSRSSAAYEHSTSHSIDEFSEITPVLKEHPSHIIEFDLTTENSDRTVPSFSSSMIVSSTYSSSGLLAENLLRNETFSENSTAENSNNSSYSTRETLERPDVYLKNISDQSEFHHTPETIEKSLHIDSSLIQEMYPPTSLVDSNVTHDRINLTESPTADPGNSSEDELSNNNLIPLLDLFETTELLNNSDLEHIESSKASVSDFANSLFPSKTFSYSLESGVFTATPYLPSLESSLAIQIVSSAQALESTVLPTSPVNEPTDLISTAIFQHEETTEVTEYTSLIKSTTSTESPQEETKKSRAKKRKRKKPRQRSNSFGKDLKILNQILQSFDIHPNSPGEARQYQVIDLDDTSSQPTAPFSSSDYVPGKAKIPASSGAASLPVLQQEKINKTESKCYYSKKWYESRSSFFRDEKNCTKCTCKDGELRCAPRHCPPPHCEAPLHGDCCDYCPGDCVVDQQVYLPGEKFSPDLDPCRECKCEGGRPVCHDLKCPSLACSSEYQARLPDECCPVCVPPEPGCFWNGRFFYTGQLWVRRQGGCNACLCKERGEVQCNPVVCVVGCQHPQFVPGDCCPLCEGCQHRGEQYKQGQTFPHPSDPCSTCQCQSGNITCFENPCKTVDCGHAYKAPNMCCPECGDCEYEGEHIKDGNSHIFSNTNGTCMNCTCSAGDVRCSATECLTSCELESGRRVGPGAQFSLDSDPCTLCRCNEGQVECRTQPCATECTHGVLLQGSCCLDCTNCEYKGELYRDLEVFRPPDERCLSCLCARGNVLCEDTCEEDADSAEDEDEEDYDDD